VLTRLALALPDPADAHQARALAPCLDLARRLVAASGDHGVILWQLSGLARRLGAHDEAIAWCQRAEQSDPGARATIMLGYALRSAGRFGEMHEAWVRALSRDPGNVDLRVDIAEQLASSGRPDEGLPWLEEALKLDPAHPKAFPSACEMRYARDEDVAHLVRLADWWREQPEHGYADRMLARACHGRPWLSVVPQPREAICNLAVQVAEAKPGQLGETCLEISLSALEVPSAMAAVKAAMPGAEITAAPDTPEPDIRTPLADGRYRLWTYDGTRATPAVPAPSAAAVAALHAVASNGFWPHPVAAYDAAVSLSGLGLDDLLGLLAHVTPVPGDPPWQRLHRGNPVYWLRFAQAWACLGLLHHRADEPWPSSTRRSVLIDLARGAEDWATDAALNAMVVGAWVDPGIRDDVANVVGFRFLDGLRAYQRREVTIIGSMAHLTLATPAMEPEVCALARDLLARDAANGDAHDEGAPGR
jgi:tetratricopeptide (TPR) repeat protein